MSRTKTSRASKKTVLAFGLATTSVALYKTSGDPDAVKASTFVKAGPNGLPLETAPAQHGKRHEDGVAKRTGAAQEAADNVDALAPSKPAAPVDEAPEENPITIETFEVGKDRALTETEIRRGVQTLDADGDEQFVDLTPQLDYIDDATVLEEMRIVGFIERRNVKTEQIVGSYFLGADDGGAPKVLALLWHAMRDTSRVAVTKWTKGKKQSLGVITPQPNGALLVVELLWDAQIREPGKKALAHATEVVTKGEVAAATDLLRAMSHGPDLLPEQADDRYVMQRDLLQRVEDGKVGEFDMPAVEAAPTEDTQIEALLAQSAKKFATV